MTNTNEAPAVEPARVAVAKAIHHGVTGGDEDWSDLEPDEQVDFLKAADDAIRGHMLWLSQTGHRVCPPNNFPAPSCEEEARAMMQAAKDHLAGVQRKAGLLSRVPGKLLLPSSLN